MTTRGVRCSPTVVNWPTSSVHWGTGHGRRRRVKQEGAHLFLDLLKAYQVRERERERERELGTNGDYILIMVYF